jgi:hypothetical protein
MRIYFGESRRAFPHRSRLPSRPMTPTAALLASLDTITAETTTMLSALDDAGMTTDRREAKRRVLEIRARAQELFRLARGCRAGGAEELDSHP